MIVFSSLRGPSRTCTPLSTHPSRANHNWTRRSPCLSPLELEFAVVKPQSRPVLQLVLSSNAYPPKLPRLPYLGGNGILVTTHATLHATVAA